ncbi:hypothetical protein AnigIFM63604_004665, partial [Aspergillus niger]
MSAAPYFSTVTSESAFRARYEAENGKSFADIISVSASDWGRQHLLACRVVRRDLQRSVLPLLSQFTQPSDLSSSTEISRFIDGPSANDLTRSEHSLVRNSTCGVSLAQAWSSMAMFKGGQDGRRNDIVDSTEEENKSDSETRTKRLRRSTLLEDYVDTNTIQIGSSSPLADGSQGTSSIGYIDMESHISFLLPEDETLRLASCVIRHILYFAPPQDSSSMSTVVEFRDVKSRLAASTPTLARTIVATDDGGLCLREELRGVFKVSKDRVALLEAKRRFQCLENGRPIISDECFAQMTCEALVARIADPLGELGHS